MDVSRLTLWCCRKNIKNSISSLIAIRNISRLSLKWFKLRINKQNIHFQFIFSWFQLVLLFSCFCLMHFFLSLSRKAWCLHNRELRQRGKKRYEGVFIMHEKKAWAQLMRRRQRNDNNKLRSFIFHLWNVGCKLQIDQRF